MRPETARLLIVNADDLGLAPGVTAGIVDLARRGAVTSTSVMANMPGCPDALAAAHTAGLDVGVHLNICTGLPLTPPQAIPSLVRGDGSFALAATITRRRFRGALRLADVEREWRAQIERVLALGVRPSHLDSHCHLHAMPGLFALSLRLARRYGIPGVRRAYSGYLYQLPRRLMLRTWRGRPRPASELPIRPDHFSVLTNLPTAWQARALHALLQTLPPGVHELVCHPGYVDDELRRVDTLTVSRETELAFLSRPAFHDVLAATGVRLVSWADIAASMA